MWFAGDGSSLPVDNPRAQASSGPDHGAIYSISGAVQPFTCVSNRASRGQCFHWYSLTRARQAGRYLSWLTPLRWVDQQALFPTVTVFLNEHKILNLYSTTKFNAQGAPLQEWCTLITTGVFSVHVNAPGSLKMLDFSRSPDHTKTITNPGRTL